ncbi:diguanylate cyclase [Thauera sp. JM12B12]|uniref:diguanylate cyclase domain-containing protein n=1 Tax=Thauera sp. JM12B12 TaxID=3142262 RepID=UPI0031F3B82B
MHSIDCYAFAALPIHPFAEAEPLPKRRMHPPTPRPPQHLQIANAVLLFACYWIAWQVSALFEVQAHVSALYLSAGLSTAAGMICGWRILPWAFLAILTVRQLGVGGGLSLALDWGGALRQVVCYGGAGLLLRSHWLAHPTRLTLPTALHFVTISLGAVTLSAATTLFIPPFRHLPTDTFGEVFLAFWGGDFAGVLFGVPAFTLAWNLRHGRRYAASPDTGEVQLRNQGLPALPGLLGLAVLVSLLVLNLPQLLGVAPELSILVLFPVLLAGLTRGVLFAYLTAVIVCAVQVVGGRLLEVQAGSVTELQLLLAMSAATALLAGAAHDDRHFAWRLASRDPLTGLANRHRFQEQLDHELLRAPRTGGAVGLMYIDLDGFKAVNDRLGHHAGDALLQQVASRLRACVRATDTVARLGGDEFAIILPVLHQAEDAAHIGEKLLARLAEPYQLDAETAHISASIGFALHPRDGRSATELIHSADRAMYEAKRLGRNRIVRHGTGGG